MSRSSFTISARTSNPETIPVAAFFEPLVREFGWSYTQVSFATSLRGIEMSLLSPVIGFLVELIRHCFFTGGVYEEGFCVSRGVFCHNPPPNFA
jgi:hypothetical protein